MYNITLLELNIKNKSKDKLLNFGDPFISIIISLSCNIKMAEMFKWHLSKHKDSNEN